MDTERIQQLTEELFAVIFRYSKESDITILEVVVGCHKAAERMVNLSILDLEKRLEKE